MNNVRYKTTRLLKKTSMYRSRYVYDRHYLPTVVCFTYALQLMQASVLQHSPITPCIFFSNMKSIKNSARDLEGEKYFFFCKCNHLQKW